MTEELVANFSLNNQNFDALFEINAAGTVWGDIEGSIENQTDLWNYLQLANTALQPNDNISELTNDAGYITSAALPTVNNATITIQKNGSTVESFGLNQSNNETINITVPTTAADVGALPDTTTINDLTTTAQQNALNSGATTANIGQITTNATNITNIKSLIPNQATSLNQLADKDFVNSSIASNTANFIGTFASVTDLNDYSGTVTNNDYAFVINGVVTDNGNDWATLLALDEYDKTLLTNFDYAWVVNGTNFDLYRFDIVEQEWDLRVSDTAKDDVTLNTAYNRYKATVNGGVTWEYEYTLNNSSFTAAQWAAINSGVTSSDVTLIDTALQPNDNITQLTNNAGYITASDVGNGTLTIQANGSTVATFTANQSGDTTANISIPDSATWGNITGDLSDQTDLITALSLKQDVLTSANAGTDISILNGAGGTETVSGNNTIVLEDAAANGLNSVTVSGGCEQTYLPSGYTRTITTTGNATAASKIDTGLIPQDGDVIEAHFKSGTAGVSFYMFQSRASSGASIYGLSGSSSGGTIALTVSGLTLTSQIGRVEGQEFYVRTSFINGNATIYVKNLTTGTEDTQTGTYNINNIAPTTNYYLWGNTVNYLNRSYPTYEVKLTNNGVTRLHYIPCTRNSDSVAGFYDLATSSFVTAETNVWTAGEETPSPDYPLDIISNNGVIKAHNQSGIPLGYQRVEYLQSTGTQYIDTGYKGNGNTKVHIKVRYYTETSNSGSGRIFGSRETQTSKAFAIGSNSGVASTSGKITFFFGNQAYLLTNKNIVLNEWLDITFDKTIHNINGINYGEPYNNETFETPQTLKIFGFTNEGVMGYGVCDCSELQLWNNDILVRNFVPCRRNSDSVLGMYDTVSGTFLTNAGTGTFTAGNDVTTDFEIYTDGTIELIEDSLENVATAEMLCGIGNYKDTQELLSGAVTRKVGVIVLNGTEEWGYNTSGAFYCDDFTDILLPNECICSHFVGVSSTFNIASMPNNSIKTGSISITRLYVKTSDYVNVQAFKTWLAQQSANGTPVIIVYPLATETTETVTGQTLEVEEGNNTIEITQASIDNLPISANYDKQGGTIISFTNDTGYITSSDVGNATLTITQGGTTKGTFTANASSDVTINLDAGGGGTVDQTYDATSTNAQSGVAIAGELTNYQATLVSGTNIKTVGNTSLLGSGDINAVLNTATGSNSLTIMGTAATSAGAINIGSSTTASSSGYSVAIGNSAKASGVSAVALGRGAQATNTSSVAIGRDAQSTAAYAIQIGKGTNATASTLAIGFNGTNYDLLDGTTGLIPDARISSSFVKTTSLATVATTGAYSDLTGQPTIPTVNNATLTIQKNGTNVQTFTANASSNKTANIIVPTATSDLTNNSGFITSSAIANMQTTTNLVTSVSSSSTDSQYPSAKLFYDTCGDIETALNTIRGV